MKLNPKTKQLLINLARMLLSAGLLTFVVLWVGPGKLAEIVRQADWRPYALALALALVGIVLRAYRWQILLNAVGARVPFRRAVYLYFVGAFFNTFLPTGFGGDVVRVLEIGAGASSQQAAGTAVVDRLTGFLVSFLLALVALPFAAGMLPPTLLWGIAMLAVGVVAASALLFEGRFLRWLTARFPRVISLAGDAWIGKTYSVITACGAKAIAGAMFCSLIFNVSQIGAIALVGRALGLPAPLWVYFVFVPVVTTALLLPITFSGLGVREIFFNFLFEQIGTGSALATSFSFGMYSLDFVLGLVGGAIYFAAGLLGLRNRTGLSVADAEGADKNL